jgi:hypothetical protein
MNAQNLQLFPLDRVRNDIGYAVNDEFVCTPRSSFPSHRRMILQLLHRNANVARPQMPHVDCLARCIPASRAKLSQPPSSNERARLCVKVNIAQNCPGAQASKNERQVEIGVCWQDEPSGDSQAADAGAKDMTVTTRETQQAKKILF